jgi:hypothetical protein
MDMPRMKIQQEQILEDIKISFDNFLLKNDPQEINRIWKNLHHARIEGWFDKEFYIYWLAKCLNTPDAKGACILCLSAITRDICGLSEKDLGNFLMPRIDFIINLNEHDKALDVIHFALQGSAVFEKAWLINKLNQINIEDKTNFIRINNQNEAIFFNSSL